MSTSISVPSADQIADNYTSADAKLKKAVDDRVQQAAALAELLDEDGKIDADLIIERAYAELKTKQVVSIEQGNDDRFDPETSSSKEELAQAVFEGHLNATDAEGNAVEKKSYEKCLSLVWNHTVMTGRGRIQQRLEADKLLLVRGTVFRNGNTIKSGVFVTKNPEIVLREYLNPRLETLRKVTEALKGDFDLALERDKSLQGPMQAAIESAVVEAEAKLPTAQLGSGSQNGTKSLGK